MLGALKARLARIERQLARSDEPGFVMVLTHRDGSRTASGREDDATVIVELPCNGRQAGGCARCEHTDHA